MEDLDNNQFQPNINNNEGALQGDEVATVTEAVPNGEAQKKHHLSTYSDEEKKWLAQVADEERSKGKGFMMRLKERWDERYPNKSYISKQNLRDNSARFKQQLSIINNTNVEREVQPSETQQNTPIKIPTSRKWTNEMKINVLKIYQKERAKGRGFMKRMKEAWDTIYDDIPMSAQMLRDNAARFQKDKALLNLLEVRDGEDVEPEVVQPIDLEEHDVNRGNQLDEEGVANVYGIEENENNANEQQEEEGEETKQMRLRFEEILESLRSTTKENMEEREKLPKLKKGISNTEIERANKILEKKLESTDDMCIIVDAVYAMGRTIAERKGIKPKDKSKRRRKHQGEENRRISKMEKQLKEARQIVAWSANEMNRRKTKRKATKKERQIVRRLEERVGRRMNSNAELIQAKEKALGDLRYLKVKVERARTRDARIRNNRMFVEDQAMFYRRTQGASEKTGKVPNIEKFENFWAGIWEDETQTPYRKWMNTVARKLREKVTHVQEFVTDNEKLKKTVKKRKNWSAPGIDGIQNYWWKKLTGTWKGVTNCFQKWMEQPEEIPKWLTEGRTVLLSKTEDVSSEKNYRPITCLNTVYKIFTGQIGSYMKDHADRNNIWDKSQLGTCSGVLGTVDQLVIDNAIMDEVREKQRNLAVAFYDYQKAYDMVRHDWMMRVYRWMGVPEKILDVIYKLMSGWNTRLEISVNGKTIKSRSIRIARGFLQGDSFSPVGFCLTEVPVAILLEETDGYIMGQEGERGVKRTHSLFVDDLKVYQENHQKLEIVNEIIVKASMDTGACYGVKKCAEIVFKKGRMVKGEGLTVLEEKMKALDPSQNEIYKFLGCEQADKIDVKRVMERVKTEIRKRLDHLVSLNLNDQNLVRAINSRVIPVAGYVMNVCRLGKTEINELDKILKTTLRREGYHGRQSSDERLFTSRGEGGRGFKSFNEVYQETKTRVACYLATSTDQWLKAAWKNETSKEHVSLKREAETAMANAEMVVTFGEGYVENGQERYENWKEAWTKLKKKLNEGQKKNKKESFKNKTLQSEIPSKYEDGDYEWLKSNTDPRKTAAIFTLQEQMVETKAWKKLRGLTQDDNCRLCGVQRETVQHLLSGCKKLAGSEYVRRHNNALKVLAVKWAMEKGLVPEGTKWYTEKWEKGKVLENGGKKLYWDWEHRMRTTCTARRPDLTLEDDETKTILLVDMACPNEANKNAKREEKIKKYEQLCFETRERRNGFTVKVIPIVIGCLGGGMRELKNDMKAIFGNDNEQEIINTMREMQKTVLWESESMIRKVLSGLLI